MSDKSDQFLMAFDALMKIKGQRRQAENEPLSADNSQTETPKSGIAPFDNSSIKMALDTLLKMKEQHDTNETAEESALSENKQSAEPQSGAPEPDYIPEQSVNSYSPKHKFNWQNEARISYNPARPRPVREEPADTPSLYSWPTDRRRERRSAGSGPAFRTPTYRYKEESFAFEGKAKNSAGTAPASDAQPLRAAGRDSGFVRSRSAPYGFYRPNQA